MKLSWTGVQYGVWDFRYHSSKKQKGKKKKRKTKKKTEQRKENKRKVKITYVIRSIRLPEDKQLSVSMISYQLYVCATSACGTVCGTAYDVVQAGSNF